MAKILKIDNKYQNSALNLSLDTIKTGKQAFVFVNTKRSAEKVAEDISKKIKDIDIKTAKNLEELSAKILKVLSKPTRQCERLAGCIKKGAAFHHAGLAPKQREIIEDEFRKGTIKIIACTPTLAAGVDLPAFRTIIRDLKRYGRFGLSWIPVLEYLQQAGRAGRPSFDKYGEAIIIASSDDEKEKIYERYINGEPEKIQSKLAVEPVLRTYLLSLISANFLTNRERIMQFFSKTFWAHQFEDMGRIEMLIEKCLALLEEWEFVKSSQKSGDFMDAGEINSYSVKATPIGKRVAELYIDPYTAHFLIENLRKASSKSGSINEISFIHLVSSTLEMRPQLKAKTKDDEAINEFLLKYENYFLEKEPSMFEPDYDEYLSYVKTAMFMNDWLEEKDEEYLLESYDIRPGEINNKLAVADWLLYSSEELARMLHFQELLKEVKKTRFRLKYGIKEELIPLVRLKNIGRVRARILFNNRIKDISDIKKADLSALKHLIGEKVALDIKSQVDEDPAMTKFKPGKRKGQFNLERYNEE